MVSRRLSRAVLLFALAVTTLMFIAISFDAQAQRFGGMRSFGRQSSNIMKQRQAVKPPAAASSSRQQQGASAASARQQQAGAQGAAARSGKIGRAAWRERGWVRDAGLARDSRQIAREE